MNTVPRLSAVSAPEFAREYLAGEGKPAIVTDAMNDWPAREWSFELFRKRYGSKIIQVSSALADNTKARWVRLDDYIDYIEHPESSPLTQMSPDRPFYAYAYKPFSKHAELRAAFSTPYFLEDWYQHLEEPLLSILNPGWLLLGGKHTVSHLHQDFFSTHTWFAQVKGVKEFLLFAPSDAPYLYGGAVNPLAPDLERFPLFEKASPYRCTVGPGDVLSLPADWWHHVVAVEESITLSFEFVNATNFNRFMTALLRDLPNTVQRFLSLDALSALGANWLCKGFMPRDKDSTH
ncbi:MAG: cupin-like domain-containing protein [Polyangiaceae bacterium]